MRRWAICLYWLAVGVAMGHMFLLVGCGRGARPYGSIMYRWAICFYWLAVGVRLGHMFLLCVCMCICFHREGIWWRYISSSNKLKLKCTLSKLCVNDPYKAASCRH